MTELLKKTYSDFSKKYDPRELKKDIKILFVAESPPKPKYPDSPDYFYNENSQDRKGALWWHFNQALYSDKFHEKAEFLSQFQHDGYFLIDVFQTKRELVEIREEVKLKNTVMSCR